jgi:hypothetical protein
LLVTIKYCKPTLQSMYLYMFSIDGIIVVLIQCLNVIEDEKNFEKTSILALKQNYIKLNTDCAILSKNAIARRRKLPLNPLCTGRHRSQVAH